MRVRSAQSIIIATIFQNILHAPLICSYAMMAPNKNACQVPALHCPSIFLCIYCTLYAHSYYKYTCITCYYCCTESLMIREGLAARLQRCVRRFYTYICIGYYTSSNSISFIYKGTYIVLYIYNILRIYSYVCDVPTAYIIILYTRRRYMLRVLFSFPLKKKKAFYKI